MEAVIDLPEVVDASVGPRGSLEQLSQSEIEVLLNSGSGGIHPLFRKCALAVLNSGSDSDNARDLFDRFRNFDVQVVRHPWGIRLEIHNAPATAFVDGQMIRGIKEHLFAVLRDVVFITHEVEQGQRFDLTQPASITNAVFHVLRNARILERKIKPNLVVCWGGHSISNVEYQYTKKVGYEIGLRGMDVCTGCGPGAMKGPMKGATIGHAKQRIGAGRYIGLTEPGIIAAEPPNAIVNQLVIMPDIEKRLEAFVRLSHGIVVFPGGAGTAEEILYLLGILLAPENADQVLPVVLTGPAESAGYFEQFRNFIRGTLGEDALSRLQVVVGDPAEAARQMVHAMGKVRSHRRASNDSYNFNWLLHIPEEFQHPFIVTHESMRALELHRDQPAHKLVANLRRAFSGIVSGNVKDFGIAAIEQRGPYELSGDPQVMRLLDELLQSFVAAGRMKLPGSVYKPCYRLVA
ncbi:MAG TPA: nucleotide 5'-monophosphate nucleosidase PpnN [Steroidobacteraceae bacterium]|nr:nucleotide 5'-monophosphate nucleosidase PpnN [Steroidobacteraceae bacterium]